PCAGRTAWSRSTPSTAYPESGAWTCRCAACPRWGVRCRLRDVEPRVEPCLPQHDPRPGPRFRRVAAACEAYRYEHQGPIAFLEHLPRRDDFPRSYRLKRTFTALRFGLDVALVRLQQAWRRPSFEEHARYYPLFRRKPAVIRRF